MLTVRELLNDLDVCLVTGESSLDVPVRWVHISELLDPTPWLSGGELLLTTGLQLGGDAQQREYVARLSAHGLSGLGFGAGFSHDRVPPALEEAAADLGSSPLKVFWLVTFPLSLPGVGAGILLCFIPIVGEFVIPDLLAGSDSLMIGQTLWLEFFTNKDWPVASAAVGPSISSSRQ